MNYEGISSTGMEIGVSMTGPLRAEPSDIITVGGMNPNFVFISMS